MLCFAGRCYRMDSHTTPSRRLSAMTTETLELTQEALESQAMADGQRRYQKRVQKASEKGQAATVGGGLSFVREAIQPLEIAFLTWMEQSGQKRGAKHVALPYVAAVGADVAAYMTVRTVLNLVAGGGNRDRVHLSMTACEIADLITDELRWRKLRDQAPKFFEARMENMETTHYGQRKKILDQAARVATVRDDDGNETPIDMSAFELPHRTRVLIGTKCIDLLMQATDAVAYVDTVKVRTRKGIQQDKVLAATPETLMWLRDRSDAMEFLWPVALPMVEKPAPWSPGVRGGYRYALRGKYKFVRGCSKAHQATLESTEMPVVYAAVNAIQDTAWRINTDVLDLMELIVKRGGGIAGIPELIPEPDPQRPERIEAFDKILKQRKRERVMATRRKEQCHQKPLDGPLADYDVLWKAWSKKTGRIRTANARKLLDAEETRRMLSVARQFRESPEMYFPHNLDFRGRVYPVASGGGLTPQGDDRAKALLTFAHGKALGEHGVRYLAQHGANCLGETPDGRKVSRMTIKDRVEWIVGHTEMICGVANDPLAHTWWAKADDPLQFFAFCCEWARLNASLDEEGAQPADFISTLPVAQDGSCNGLQHYSAILKDEQGGRAVNLTPNVEPEDIYTRVLDQATARILRDASDPAKHAPHTKTVTKRVRGEKVQKVVVLPADGVLAEKWIASGLLTRKLAKRPVMTFPYGSKTFGFKSQIIEYLEHRGSTVQESKQLWLQTRKHFSSPEGYAKSKQQGDTRAPADLLSPAAGYLARCFGEAISQVVVKAGEAMDWLQAAARHIAGTGVCVQWTVPCTGFPVKQEYYEMKSGRVETVLLGKVYKPRSSTPTTKPALYKQANAVAPNFVHSLDAACLMLTVQRAQAAGVSSFGMIHDSYGTVAGDAAELAKACREAFVAIYAGESVLAGLEASVVAHVPEKKRKAMPTVPGTGTLELDGVLRSDFFFA